MAEDAAFSWSAISRSNLAYEAFDMVDEKERKKIFAFADIKAGSNKAANILRKYGVGKGDYVFIFMPRSPELYFNFIGIFKIGAIAVPLFKDFTEGALRDLLVDREAAAIIITPEFKGRILRYELPNLKYVFVVGANGELGQREIDWDAEFARASTEAEPEWVDPNYGDTSNIHSGKIMRRILKAWEQEVSVGDSSES